MGSLVEVENRKRLQGRRFTKEQRDKALGLLSSGMGASDVAKIIGTTTQSLTRWKEAASKQQKARDGEVVELVPAQDDKPVVNKQQGRSPYAPTDPANGLSPEEIAGILEYKRKHASYGPAQLRAQLKRFRGWRLSLKAIAKVLKANGYELVHRGSRPKGLKEPTRFEAPRRNALWQLDFLQLRVAGEVMHVVLVLDDFSRFIVGHGVGDAPSTEVAVKTLRMAMARHGKPEAVRTDRGGAFLAFTKESDFGKVLEAELIDHIVGHSYHPQGGGKVESAVGTVKRELWEVEHFATRQQAEHRLAQFIDDYNHRRAHMGIDGLTPADRFMGRADRVLAEVDAVSRKRQGALAMTEPTGAIVEEMFAPATGAPLEVLRLMLVDGVMELRFCGARVRLGRVVT
ncbi:MAG: transposase family protein [Deltaproteobacteria bacterium]|nr:transposase family protein [Deltaproteobacteria bacterium]